MDDLFANAWGDPNLLDLTKSENSSSWLSPKPTEEEADLAAPSWSTGTGIHWNEPSEESGLSWVQGETDVGWGTSTYEGIEIGKSEDGEDVPVPPISTGDDDEVPVAPPLPETHANEEALATLPREDEVLSPSSITYSPDAAVLSPPADSDTFGTFKTAIIPDEDAAITLEQNDPDVNAWGSAWASDLNAAETDTEVVDEWETAKRQKAKQDRKVPPEVLAAILAECEQFVRESWPESAQSSTKDDDWRNNIRSGLEGVEGLASFAEAFLPPLTLSPPVQFGKTAIAKHMATSVRLTKNFSLTKQSPMSHYLSAKGSLAWETAMKGHKEAVQDDVPVGWRILEKEPLSETVTEATKDKKAGGGIFSFWGRREPKVLHSRSSSRAEVPSQAPFEISMADEGSSHSRRPSQDSVRSLSRINVDKAASPIASLASPAPSQSPISASELTSAISAPVLPSIPASHAHSFSTTSYSTASEYETEAFVANAPAPSAVSRFLNRFSRRRSTMGNSSPHSSLALSADDLEFLSEVVPSVNDDHDDEETTLKELSKAIKADHLPPMLPPPPPAPIRSATPGEPPGMKSGTHYTMSGLDSGLDLPDSSTDSDVNPTKSLPNVVANPLQPVMGGAILQPSRPATPSGTSSLVTARQDLKSLSLSPLGTDNKPQPSIGSYLPSPPSSRSQSPFSTVVPVQSGSGSSSQNGDATTRSKAAPPSFPPARSTTSPAPRALEEPDTPTSSMPLAQLYPNAVRNEPAKPKVPPKVAHSFSLPPPPSFRSQSSAGLSRPPSSHLQSSARLPPPLAPPPSMASRTSFAPPKPATLPLKSFDDDDDFSDFLSSATVPQSSQLILRATSGPSSRSGTPTTIPPPFPSSRPMISIPTLDPPSQPPSSSKTTSLLSDAFDDGDFFDFHSSSATALKPSLPSSLSLSFDSPAFADISSSSSSTFLKPTAAASHSPEDSFASENSFLTPAKSSPGGFDILGTSPTLRTPSPPRPISKSDAPLPSIAQVKIVEPPPSSSTNSRLNKAAVHLPTLNLLERAAARPGRWPAPKSPTPPTLPGPGGAAAPVDLLGSESPMKPQAEPMGASLSLPTLLGPPSAGSSSSAGVGLGIGSIAPPMAQSQSLQSSFFDSLQRIDAKPVAPPSSTSTAQQQPAKTGGLSAQDLSFFEGL